MTERQSYSKFLSNLPSLHVEGEDGEDLVFKGNAGLAPDRIDRWESDRDLKLPKDFREFLLNWNGADLFGLDIKSLESWAWPDPGLVDFHNWGNGDFDCLDLRKPGKAPVVFMDHETGCEVVISPSFGAWLRESLGELNSRGTLRHPMDYRDEADKGLYLIAALRMWAEGKQREQSQTWLSKVLGWTVGQHGTFYEWHKNGRMKRAVVMRFGRKRRVTEWYSNGQVEMVDTSWARIRGSLTTWYPNGNKQHEVAWHFGRIHGRERYWDDTGRLTKECTWRKGKEWDGEFCMTELDGTVTVRIFEHGKLIRETKDGG